MSRGWKPRGGIEGGEVGVGWVGRTFGEEEEHGGEDPDSEGGEQGAQIGEEMPGKGGEEADDTAQLQGVVGGGECGSEHAAAALAGGSGGASAAAASVGRAVETSHTAGTDGCAEISVSEQRVAAPYPSAGPPEDFPELPEEEARRVKADLGIGCADHSGSREAVDDEGGRRKRARASTEAVTRRWQTSTATSAGHGAGYELKVDGLPSDDDLYGEDPFGHVAADLAMQPVLTRPGAAQQALVAGQGDKKRKGDRLEEGPQAPGWRRRTSGSGSAQGTVAIPGEVAARGSKRLGGREWQDTGRKRARHGRSDDTEEQTPKCSGEAMAGSQFDAAGPEAEVDVGSGRASRGFGRRYTGIVADPVDAEESNGHTLHITGPVIWCSKCGRYALRRVRRSLRSSCVGQALGAYGTRLARLREGRHPLTNASLID